MIRQANGRGPHDRTQLALRRVEALKLRQTGMSFDEIARELGYVNKSGAFKAVRVALREFGREPAHAVRQLEDVRLDALWQAYFPLAIGERSADGKWIVEPDYHAADVCLKLMRRRAELWGLDEPRKVAHSVIVEHDPVADRARIIGLLESLEARAFQAQHGGLPGPGGVVEVQCEIVPPINGEAR